MWNTLGAGLVLGLVLVTSGSLSNAQGTSVRQFAPDGRQGLQGCRLPGVEHEALCGSLRRPLDVKQPNGATIELHFAVLPALARNRKPDPVLFFAGGPGQSAIELAGPVGRMLARLGNRRDIVLVDQRGTGRSAPLACAEVPVDAPLADAADPVRQRQRLQACVQALQRLPHGDLRHFTTWVATQDVDAVRQALGAQVVNLVGGSYGTRVALDYQRQYPQRVRRTVIDGVAPPDVHLTEAAATDNQAALDAVFAACDAHARCRQRYPGLRQDWQRLLASLPRTVAALHPVSGQAEPLLLTRAVLLSWVRAPLYTPLLASALPLAISEASQNRFEPLLGLASALAGRRQGRLYEGMHFAVMCSEDVTRLESAPALANDFGDSFTVQYRQICRDWPRAEVPAAFYRVAPAPSATLLFSGGADPVTPTRLGEHAARALGAQARHVVVPHAGHGLLGLACLRDVLFKFIDAETDAEALRVDANCAASLPRPLPYVPLLGGHAGSTTASATAIAASLGARR